MRPSKFRLLSALTLFGLVFSTSIFAAGFQLYEVSSPEMGFAGAGQAAFAENAAISYFNPAGMTQLKHSQMLLGTQMMIVNAQFQQNSKTTISGDDGGNAGNLFPGFAAYYVYSYSNNLKFGLSVNTPYVGGLNYSNGWVGRYSVQSVSLVTINVNPSVAYRVNQWFSVGGGVSVEYTDYREDIAASIPADGDGQINVKMNAFTPGFNFGLLFTPQPGTRIGLAYRSEMSRNLRGSTTFYRLSGTPPVSTELKTPQTLILSAYQNLTKKVAVLADLGWADWSVFNNTIINVSGVTATIPRHWKDTWRIGLGFKYDVTSKLALQLGASYDSSVTKANDRLPDLPMDRQYRFGTGVIYKITKSATLNLAYEYMDFGKAAINNTTSNGTLAGNYPVNNINAFTLNINVLI